MSTAIKTWAALISFFIGSCLMADSEAAPFAKVSVSASGTAFFKIAPHNRAETPDPTQNTTPSGTAYLVMPDGRIEEQWSVRGWYAEQVYISDDARFLVRMGPWSWGDQPKKSDLAVAFYVDGRLLKEYSTVDLLKDPSKIVRSVSHYEWLSQPVNPADVRPSMSDYDKSFSLVTCDGWIYRFSLESGEIVENRRSEPIVGQWATSEKIDRLAIALLVAKYPIAYQDFFEAIGLDYYQVTGGMSSGNLHTRTFAITDPTAPGGYEAVEIRIDGYDYKGGEDGAGAGNIVGASLIHVSAKNLRFEWIQSQHLKRYCEEQRERMGASKQTPTQFAEQFIKKMNGRYFLTY